MFSNIPKDLGLLISPIIRKLKKDQSISIHEVLVGLKDFGTSKVHIEAKTLDVDGTYFFAVTFREEKVIEVGSGEGRSSKDTSLSDKHFISKVEDLEKELQYTKENLQATVEELETSNEELQSSNEELIASNEELQSTNEELQSVNEELYTVNSEFQLKIDELTALNNDVNNLLNNTEVGALYIDRNMCIRKITPFVSKITNILPTDIGRPIAHLSVMRNYETLLSDVYKVVETLQPIDKEITGNQGKAYLSRIRPYRTDYNAVEGILITFVDITTLKRESSRADIATERLYQALKMGNMAWWEWDIKTGVVLFDERKATMLGYTLEEFPVNVYEICKLIHPEDYDSTMKAMRDYIEGQSSKWEMTYRIKRKDGSYAWYYDKGSVTLRDSNGNPLKIIGTVIDVSRLKNLEYELKFNREILEKVLYFSPVAHTMVEKDGCISYANQKALELFKITQDELEMRQYNSSEWEITDLDGNEIPNNKLPYSIIMDSRNELKDYKHYIRVRGGDRILLSIDGAPVYDEDNNFSSCIFCLKIIDG